MHGYHKNKTEIQLLYTYMHIPECQHRNADLHKNNAEITRLKLLLYKIKRKGPTGLQK